MHQELGTDLDWNGETITKSNGFLFQLQSPSFVIDFKILLRILYGCKELTVKLQIQAINVIYVYQQVTSAIFTLKKMKEDESSQFHLLFTEITKLGHQFGLSIPRIVG